MLSLIAGIIGDLLAGLGAKLALYFAARQAGEAAQQARDLAAAEDVATREAAARAEAPATEAELDARLDKGTF